jgi:catabolite regulation protein CreA
MDRDTPSKINVILPIHFVTNVLHPSLVGELYFSKHISYYYHQQQIVIAYDKERRQAMYSILNF